MSQKQTLIRGTAILTLTSFCTRFIGFFYRIFLSHTFGEENVGLYQLVFPVYALGFSLSCAGVQLALSRCVARHTACGEVDKAKELLKTSLLFYFYSFLYYCRIFTASFSHYIDCPAARCPVYFPSYPFVLCFSIRFYSQLYLRIFPRS